MKILGNVNIPGEESSRVRPRRGSLTWPQASNTPVNYIPKYYFGSLEDSIIQNSKYVYMH